jgi:hypothetical protein
MRELFYSFVSVPKLGANQLVIGTIIWQVIFFYLINLEVR